MEILDIHTHHLPAIPGRAIFSTTPAGFAPESGQYYSVGFHPWYLSEDGSEDWNLLNEIALNPQVLAIGEAGLDKVIDLDFSLQKTAFEKQISIAESVGKPLIIHSVRSYNEVIELRKASKTDVPWIIHGFRGKKELAEQLIKHGICLSYGFRYQEEAVRVTPLDMLFLETDESNSDICTLYEEMVTLLPLSFNELTEKVQENISNVFFQK